MRLYVDFLFLTAGVYPVIIKMPKRYEFIIIGAGPAGLRVAERLRDRSRVLILESSDRIGGALPEWVLLRDEDLRHWPDNPGIRPIAPVQGNLMVCAEATDPERPAELQDYEEIHMYYAMGRGMPEYGNNAATHIAPRESLIQAPTCKIVYNTRVTEVERNQLDFCVHTEGQISYRANVVIVAGAYGIRYTRCSPGVNTGLLSDYEFWFINARMGEALPAEIDSDQGEGTAAPEFECSQSPTKEPQRAEPSGLEYVRADSSCPISAYQVYDECVEAVGELGYFSRNPPTDGLVSQVLGFPVHDVKYEKKVCHYWNKFDNIPFYSGGVFACGEVAVRHHGWAGESVKSADSAVSKVMSRH